MAIDNRLDPEQDDFSRLRETADGSLRPDINQLHIDTGPKSFDAHNNLSVQRAIEIDPNSVTGVNNLTHEQKERSAEERRRIEDSDFYHEMLAQNTARISARIAELTDSIIKLQQEIEDIKTQFGPEHAARLERRDEILALMAQVDTPEIRELRAEKLQTRKAISEIDRDITTLMGTLDEDLTEQMKAFQTSGADFVLLGKDLPRDERRVHIVFNDGNRYYIRDMHGDAVYITDPEQLEKIAEAEAAGKHFGNADPAGVHTFDHEYQHWIEMNRGSTFREIYLGHLAKKEELLERQDELSAKIEHLQEEHNSLLNEELELINSELASTPKGKRLLEELETKERQLKERQEELAYQQAELDREVNAYKTTVSDVLTHASNSKEKQYPDFATFWNDMPEYLREAATSVAPKKPIPGLGDIYDLSGLAAPTGSKLSEKGTCCMAFGAVAAPNQDAANEPVFLGPVYKNEIS